MKNRIDKREIFSIPNLMGYFRILLIPVFSWMYCTADSTGDYYAAAVVVGVSGLTDMFDGKIARRFNMITELGKFITVETDKAVVGSTPDESERVLGYPVDFIGRQAVENTVICK